MVLYGTLINGLCIIIGSLLGMLCLNIPDRYKETVVQGIGLVVILLGLQMALTANSIIMVLLSLLSGALFGEWIQLEERLNMFGHWIERKFIKKKQGSIEFAHGFITSSLIFSIGAMAIVGALDSGLKGDHELLITKGIMDGFTSFVFATTMGIGVLFSFVPVVIYQGLIALMAIQIVKFVPAGYLDELIVLLTGVGGLLIVAIGFNLLGMTKIRIGNLLPSLFTVIIIFYISQSLPF